MGGEGGVFARQNGERGIRTLETLSSPHAFQACALSRSAISPCVALLECRVAASRVFEAQQGEVVSSPSGRGFLSPSAKLFFCPPGGGFLVAKAKLFLRPPGAVASGGELFPTRLFRWCFEWLWVRRWECLAVLLEF